MNKAPLLYLLLYLLLPGLSLAAEDMVFRLPTDNRALYGEGGDAYFMYVDRTFEGQTSRPWQAGTWGMVRNPFRTSEVWSIGGDKTADSSAEQANVLGGVFSKSGNRGH